MTAGWADSWAPVMRADLDKAARIEMLLARQSAPATAAKVKRVDPAAGDYDLYLEALYRLAEDYTRGYLVSRDAARDGLCGRTAFYSRTSGARPWHRASEELTGGWESGDLQRPITFTQWRQAARGEAAYARDLDYQS